MKKENDPMCSYRLLEMNRNSLSHIRTSKEESVMSDSLVDIMEDDPAPDKSDHYVTLIIEKEKLKAPLKLLPFPHSPSRTGPDQTSHSFGLIPEPELIPQLKNKI